MQTERLSRREEISSVKLTDDLTSFGILYLHYFLEKTESQKVFYESQFPLSCLQILK